MEGAASSTPSRASTTYEPEQKVTVSLLIEISKEIMSLYGKAKKGIGPASPFFCIAQRGCLSWHVPSWQCPAAGSQCRVQDIAEHLQAAVTPIAVCARAKCS